LKNSTAVKYTIWNIYPTLYQMMSTGCHFWDLWSQPTLSLSSIKSIDHVKGWACCHTSDAFTGTFFILLTCIQLYILFHHFQYEFCSCVVELH
jgi:hypothetical protein